MLARPAALVVLQCALAMADDGRDAAITLLHARDDDPDAVHDFRVALRRLRSWLQLWRAELDDVVPRRQRRRIRDLAHAMGPARDLQVHLEWLRSEEAGATGRALADVERAEHAVVGAPAMVRDLRQFQDLAGDAHDVHVFSRELRGIFKKFGVRGRGALDVRLRQRGAKAYSSLAQRWLGDSSGGFFRRSATVAARLRAGAMLTRRRGGS
jgi:CHAD domain-containing protein